jgi:ribosomal protein S18 acetylase RimI-like enzyme
MSHTDFRRMEPRDVPHMVRLAIDAGMFPAEASPFLEGAAQTWFDGGPGQWIVDELDGAVVGVAFYEPRPATDRVWALTMIVVDPKLQGGGRGAALLRHVERVLRADEQRLLVIETSGTPMYDRTRRFYAKLGYDAVARVPDYFTDGDDMVLFAKDLRKT